MQTSSKKQISRAAIGERNGRTRDPASMERQRTPEQTRLTVTDQRKTDFAASVGKPGDKCIQGKGEGEKRGLGDYP